MSRVLRRVLRVLLVVLMLVSTGCLGGAGPNTGTGETDVATESSATTTKYWGAPVEDRLTVQNSGRSAYEVSIRITNESDGSVVYDRNRTLEIGSSIAPYDVFHGYRAYEVVVAVNGTEVFNETVGASQYFDLTIRAETEVDVAAGVK